MQREKVPEINCDPTSQRILLYAFRLLSMHICRHTYVNDILYPIFVINLSGISVCALIPLHMEHSVLTSPSV